MSALAGVESRKVNVLLVGESLHLFSSFRRLEKLGCQCHFAESHREVSELLTHTKLDIVLSLNMHQSLSEMTAMLAGSRVAMFHMLPVEEGWWWLPVLRYGEHCLGTSAFRPSEFTYVLTEIIKGIIADAASSGPSASKTIPIPLTQE
jgi:hypothetical protein